MNKKIPLEIESLYNDFANVFCKDDKHLTIRQREQLSRLGFDVYGYNHPKIKIGKSVVVLHSSTSDRQINRVILRRIKKILISEYEKGNIKL